jgi:hypothetical protein
VSVIELIFVIYSINRERIFFLLFFACHFENVKLESFSMESVGGIYIRKCFFFHSFFGEVVKVSTFWENTFSMKIWLRVLTRHNGPSHYQNLKKYKAHTYLLCKEIQVPDRGS